MNSSERHPRGLMTLFFTEMWERFSYYGMRALLVLFMVDAVRSGGMGLDDKTATAIYGLYTAVVYLMSLPGGWLGDRLLGARRTVSYAALLITLGHFTLAVPTTQAFYLGLVFVAVGSGFLKTNMSTLVADLYPEGGTRRDAGFTLFYMGVNLGAFLGPLACGKLAAVWGWHAGFAAAGVGMVFGWIQFHFTRHHLKDAGEHPSHPGPLHLLERTGAIGLTGLALAILILGLTGRVTPDPIAIAQSASYLITGIAAAYFAYLFFFAGLDRSEKGRIGMILLLFLSSALFWAGFEQAGSSFSLFAERFTLREFSFLDEPIPAAWFQSLGPIMVIAFAPLFAALWIGLSRHRLNPSIPVKFGIALLLLAAGFLVMRGAASRLLIHGQVMPTWLIATFLLHTFGELCLSPVGLSSVTQLAPRRLVGQMMGVWFLATSLGNLLAGLLAGEFHEDTVAHWPALYLQCSIFPVAAGVLLIVFARKLRRLAPDLS
ncbi:POT family proton-dependent oligopeptide transporter [Haloferula luteola]|uniref:POT family proton-dependent oligopeptide transporter n=1 Tax=Haloferula luteola TaxID=595692 RepID=A0A840VKF6_9BACT|nr:peptide MFS transporter [Haloferula luteola]MBB5353151.1 POT family proton-dependent oligopeptide transporter [Haloferula luteola]